MKNSCVFNANPNSAFMLSMSKSVLVGTTIFTICFLPLLAWSHLVDGILELEFMVHIFPILFPIPLCLSLSALFLFVSFIIRETFKIDFNHAVITYTKKILFVPVDSRNINLNEVEIVAVSSRLFFHKGKYAMHPSLSFFLKSGEEIYITTYLHQNFAKELMKINENGAKLAHRMNCKFLPGVAKGETKRRELDGEIHYAHFPHQEVIKDYKGEEGKTSPINLEDL